MIAYSTAGSMPAFGPYLINPLEAIMPEKDQAATSAAPPDIFPAVGRPPASKTNHPRVHELTSVISLILTSGAGLGAAIFLLLYYYTGAWQALVAAAGIAIIFFCAYPVHQLVRRGKKGTADYLMVFSLAFSYLVIELVWASRTTAILMGGTALILLVGLGVRPRRWMIGQA